jgi:hypothetical protein
VTAPPYPTPTRLALADAIAAGDVTAAVTARTAELAAAGLVQVDVRLTPDGMAWVTRARTREQGEGPGSTSPEPGPPTAQSARDKARDIDVFCRCEAYSECVGECCGPGNCSCDPTVRAELIAAIRAESGHSTEDGAARG